MGDVAIIRSWKRLNENEYQLILHKGHKIKHCIWIIHKGQAYKLINDHLHVLIMNYTLTQDLKLSYQHKSVTNKMLYKNSALGYKESNALITLYDIMWLFCWSLWECTRWYCWYHAVNLVRLLFKFILFILGASP